MYLVFNKNLLKPFNENSAVEGGVAVDNGVAAVKFS
jgi:hypothetical protein